MTSASAHLPARGGRLRLAFLLAMLVILSWQGYVVATHFHPRQIGTTASDGYRPSAVQSPLRGRHLPASPETCPICQEIAAAGHYLPPVPIVLAEPARVIAWYLAATRRPLHSRQRSHDWRSRAPPADAKT